MGLEDNFLKRNVRGQQNPTLIVGRLVNFKRSNYLVLWARWMHGPWERDRKVEINNQLGHIRCSAGSQVTFTRQIFT